MSTSAVARVLLILTAFPAPLVVYGDDVGAARPRLAVAISVDQLRYDYLTRFRPFFVSDGFERLLRDGTNFENCTYRYAATKTAVGHATMLTGCNPEVHGIVGNEWIDHETWLNGVAVLDTAAPLVGLAPTTMRLPGGTLDPRSGRSPRRLLAPTVGDQLKATFGPAAKIFGVSNKDRSAILMAGARADGAYWDENGRFITSTYYRKALPAWLEAFNARGFVDAQFGKTWDRLLDPAIYDRIQGPDDAAGEHIGDGLGCTFPRQIDGGLARPGAAFYTAFDNSPFATQFLAALAREIIVQEDLGADDVPDLLCVSFSQVDAIGHNYGPDSHEIMDTVLRLDRELAGFFSFLDERIGAGRYVVVLTADHGAAPLPERTSPGQTDTPTRVYARALDKRMAAALDAPFGALPEGELWFVRDNQGYLLRPSALAAKDLALGEVARVLRDALRADPIIEMALTREEVLAAPAEGNTLPALVRRSYFEPRGQDVVYVTRPYYVERPDTGTNHGTPWSYDRHVPQVYYGTGVPRGWHTEDVGVDDIAPTLAALLGIDPPARATGHRLF